MDFELPDFLKTPEQLKREELLATLKAQGYDPYAMPNTPNRSPASEPAKSIFDGTFDWMTPAPSLDVRAKENRKPMNPNFNQQKSGEKALAQITTNTPVAINPEELQALIEQVQGTPQIQKLMAGNEQLRKMAGLASQTPAQLDLSPLLALVDSMYGSKLSQGYQKPMSVEERGKQGFGYASEIQKREEDLADKIRELAAKTMAGGGTRNTLIQRQATNEDMEGTKPPPSGLDFQSKAIRDVQGKFNKDVLPFNTSLKFADLVDSLVSNTGPGSKLALKSLEKILARASTEVGNLSYYEQVGTTVPRDIISRITQAVETLKTGELTPENKLEIKGLASQYREAAKEAMSRFREIHAEQGAAAYGHRGLGYNAFFKALPASDTLKSDTPPSGPVSKAMAPATGTKSKLTPAQEARRQELLRKAGK